MAEIARQFSEQVRQAAAERTPLRIVAGGSKAFYGRAQGANSIPLDVRSYAGIVNYEPTELYVTARAGTLLAELEAALAERGQMLGCETPHFGPTATVGGAVASGLSGPRRPYAGSLRDFVLGVKIINGRGEILGFGGQVMKNVAGYDVSRLMAGALGTLGVILEVSLKVLPLAADERTLLQQCSEKDAIEYCNRWAGQPYPISATAHDGEALYIRLSGAASAVAAASAKIGGQFIDNGPAFWRGLREHELPFFHEPGPLWRLSIPPATAPLRLPGKTFLDWGGAQRWLRTDLPDAVVFAAAKAVGGHATRFRGGDRQGQIFQALEPDALKLHQRLKHSLDPQGIFNPGRMYAEF
ncbi:MAG: glycolate oxidase subunit GlcE [Gammaproteobacteria bacterium]